jgi:hypothetical protein
MGALAGSAVGRASPRQQDGLRLLLVPPVKAPAAAAGAVAAGTIAAGPFAIGALAFGALANGALAIGKLAVRKAKFGDVEIDSLTVRKLRIVEEPDAGANRGDTGT